MLLLILNRVRLFFNNGSSKDSKIKESDELKIYKSLLISSGHALDIFDIQKEILEMKMILRLMITPEQYAAI